MSTITIRPSVFLEKDGVIQGSSDSGSTWTTASDANIATYEGDASDATGLRSAGSSARTFSCTLPAPTIAADEFVARISGTIRWSGGNSSKYVGVIPYVRSSGFPGYFPATPTGGSIQTSEPGVMPKAWTLTEVANLAIAAFMDGDATAANRPAVWQLGCNLYTLKLASVVASATTMTASTYAVIPVAVTATIDWEASQASWTKLRTVTVEVRVESGGTTVGTGTLVSTASTDVLFSATGTVNTTVTLPDSLANGTYRIYSRTVRHRENELSPAADQYSAWTSAVTLTMSKTPPTAPTITATVNETTDSVAVSVTPIATTGYTSPYVTVERTDDLGITWTPVRSGTAIAGTFGTATIITDYEAPRDQSVTYRARVSAYTAGVLNTSTTNSSAAVTVSLDTWNLKCPQAPSLNFIGVTVIGNPEESIGEDLGIFRLDGRRYPITVAGTLTGWDGKIQVHTASADEWAKLKALIESQAVLLLESAFGWRKYVRLVSGAGAVMVGTHTVPRRFVPLSYVETSAPQDVPLTLPATIDITYDAGAASTSSWTATYDGGAASTSSFTETIDSGSA